MSDTSREYIMRWVVEEHGVRGAERESVVALLDERDAASTAAEQAAKERDTAAAQNGLFRDLLGRRGCEPDCDTMKNTADDMSGCNCETGRLLAASPKVAEEWAERVLDAAAKELDEAEWARAKEELAELTKERDEARAQINRALAATGRAVGVDASLVEAIEQVRLGRDAGLDRTERWRDRAERAEAERDEARALAKDAQDTRDRLAVEVQALREALRPIIAAWNEDEIGRVDGDLIVKADVFFAAPSESDRVLAAHDAGVRLAMAVEIDTQIQSDAGENGPHDKIGRSLLERDERTRVGALRTAAAHFRSVPHHVHAGIDVGQLRANGMQVPFGHIAADVLDAIAATPPSAATGKPNPFELCFHDVPRRTCPTCAASGKGAT